MDIDSILESLDEKRVLAVAWQSAGMADLAVRLGITGDDTRDAILTVAPGVEWVFVARKEHAKLEAMAADGVSPRTLKKAKVPLLKALWKTMWREKQELETLDPDIEAERIRAMEGSSGESLRSDAGQDVDPEEVMVAVMDEPSALWAEEDEGKDLDIRPSGRDDVTEEPDQVPEGEVMKKTKKVAGIKGEGPLAAGDLDSVLAGKDVICFTGAEYLGRPVVRAVRNPGRFGAPGLRRTGEVELTVHRGILNHMGIRPGRRCTPYWAVMDAMSDLKDGFTMEQVVTKAMAVMGDDSTLSACRTAWYVLKSHQTHPKESYRGMSFIVEEVEPGKFSCRARREDEMQQVFDRYLEGKRADRAARASAPPVGKKVSVEKEPVVLATHVVGEVI